MGLRVATFNLGAAYNAAESKYEPSLGVPGSADYEIIRSVITRLDPDVVALQEVHTTDVNAGNLASLASALGYGHLYFAPNTNAFDNSLRVAFLSRHPFLSQTSIASPAGAKDMTRLIPAVKVDVPGTSRDPWLFAVHLKSGTAASDLFQRAVETRRLTRHINASGLANDSNFVILGDFNPSGSSRTFDTLPSTGLPATFTLGSDITLPIPYFTDPRSYFTTPSVHLLDPRQPNGSATTFPSSGSTLDFILTSPIVATRPLAAEIYNSTLDTSNAVGLAKAGSPLPSGTSAAASDHLPVFADLELDSAVPYTFTAAGQTVSETFAGFPGTYDPYPWTSTGGEWLGADSGSSTAPGFRSYGSSADPSLGFLPAAAGGSTTAAFVNQSATTLTALQISYTAEQWRSSNGGTADTLSAELIVGGVSKPLPALTYQASAALPSGAVAGGIPTPKSMIVSGLAVAPGSTFQLRFTFTPGTGSSTPPSAVFINELNYDDNGTDDEEFVEIVAGPGFTGPLTGATLLLYNGSNGQTYGSHALSTFTAGAVTSSGHRIYSKAISGLQNDMDGMALVVNGAVTQFISYEGSFQATNGTAIGMMSADLGVSQTGADPAGTSSLGLTGTGGAPAVLSWSKFTGLPTTQGQPNSGQDFTNNILPPQGIAIDNLAVTFPSGYDADGDGSTDVDELVFGTDPQDASSRFVVSLATPSPGIVRLGFPTVAGRSYIVQSSIDLSIWTDGAAYAGTGSQRTVDQPVSPTDGKYFYRIRVSRP